MSKDNATKYREFCQFRRQVRGSSEYLIVGIDVAKTPHHAFFGTARGQSLLRRLIFENSRAGFEKLMERVSQIQTGHGLGKVVPLKPRTPKATIMMGQSFRHSRSAQGVKGLFHVGRVFE